MSHARPGPEAGTIVPRSAPPPPRRRQTTFARLVGALGLVALTALLYWMLTDEAFTVTEERVTFNGLVHANEADVRALLADLDRGPNVFRVRASDIVGELSTLTEVDAASAKVMLPADVSVTLDERDPVFIWTDRAVSWLVDERGMLFAPADLEEDAGAADTGEQDEAAADTGEPDEAAADTGEQDEAAADTGEPDPGDTEPTSLVSADALSVRDRLPVVEDVRLPEEPPTVGTFLPTIDLTAMRTLLAIDQELLGSRAREFKLRVDDSDGYVLESLDQTWRAQFGHYSLTLQPPEVIPAQVQCLRWLLAREERRLQQVRLAVGDGTCGTFLRLGDVPANGG